MKNNQQRVAGNSISSLYKSEETPKEFAYHMPPGTKFSDILMDVQEVCQELHMSKRKVYNLRRASILSYTSLSNDGKAYFFRQEIAGMLEANTVIGKNSLMKKFGISGWLTSITSFLSFFDL
ncbi:helix-turn-helix domain-containing protein [Ginsengibacter hankyongi]|uniref:Helix-turn-helix domain-containing protein n=1 Tax=Ginsengibacter hankyongi TaxID=2607284 RepID=A0A5J5INF9_9BACT|nr:helix-turn-helix domain-containing protein [Ginsengibacter hankyongi]KAA9041454.1 helix-turn-helix domain-containing protein [Ginsengibacter hankyongi]